MKSWSETLQLKHLPADVVLDRFLDAESHRIEEWERHVRESYERGRVDGANELSTQLVEQRTQMQELQEGILQSLQDCVKELTDQADRELSLLALECARKLVSGMPVDPEMMQAVVREALREVRDESSIVIHVHPEDLSLVHSFNKSGNSIHPAKSVTFESSDDVDRGGCMVRTRFGLIDARRKSKLNMIKEAITP